MALTSDEVAPEACILTDVDAELIAKAVEGKSDVLKSKRIPPSLLSAEHIKDYVLATGLISPFYIGGKKPRLKKASYEGRVGSVAYTFEDSAIKIVPINDGKIRIKANSIVFVECDLNFRLPEYIALRFNLQIKHVHRGLLLGTGPIVDPAFWGKLCIPLHNLTSEDYYLGENEGLIWIEFTKTTSKVSEAEAVGVRPSTTDFWDIKKFILKAVEGNGDGKLVEIQSSINRVVVNAGQQAAEAKTTATAAKEVADKASTTAATADTKVNRIAFGAAIGGFLAIVAIAVGLVTLVVNQFSFYDTQHLIYKEYVTEASAKLEDVKKKNEDLELRLKTYDQNLENVSKLNLTITKMQREIESIQEENSRLKEEFSQSMERSPELKGR
jgi:deoxycytidine triphosphate deaminase